MSTEINPILLKKYDTAAPRYTSYPTVPYWSAEQSDMGPWLQHVANAVVGNPEKIVSKYW